MARQRFDISEIDNELLLSFWGSALSVQVMLTVKEARHLANSLLAHRLLDPRLEEENAKIAVRLKERWEEESAVA